MLALNLELDSWAHKIKASWKLAALAVISLASYWVHNIPILCLALAFVFGLYASLGMRGVRTGLRLMRPVFWMAALIFAYHMITREPWLGVEIVLRLIIMISLANFVTMTTRLDDMMDIVERLACVLKPIGINPRIVAISCAMVIRFTPILVLKGGYLIDSWRSRSTKRPNWRLIVPFCLMALDDADHLAEALKARGGIKK